MDPGTDWREPSGQGKHFDWPSRALKVPGAQGKHSLEGLGEKLPGAQGLQVDAPTGAKKPGGHKIHSSAPFVPSVENPLGHLSQTSDPSLAA